MGKPFGQLNLHKEEFIRAIMDDQILLKFIYYEDNNIDILSQKDLNGKQKKYLKDHNIYEYKKIPTINSENVKTYISMEFGTSRYYNRQNNKYFIEPSIVLYLVTNNHLDDCYNGSRLLAIEERIKELFHYESYLNIGNSIIVSSEPLNLPSPFIGRQILVKFVDRNDKEWKTN